MDVIMIMSVGFRLPMVSFSPSRSSCFFPFRFRPLPFWLVQGGMRMLMMIILIMMIMRADCVTVQRASSAQWISKGVAALRRVRPSGCDASNSSKFVFIDMEDGG